MSNFRDVRVRRDVITTRQDEPRKSPGRLLQRGHQFMQFHTESIFQNRNIVNDGMAVTAVQAVTLALAMIDLRWSEKRGKRRLDA